MNNFRVTFDEVNSLISFKDTAEVGETQVIVMYPDEIEIDYGRTLTASNDWANSVLSRQDLAGNLMQGRYVFTVNRYSVGGTSPTGSETSEFVLEYENVPPVVSENIALFTPSISLTDSTNYDTVATQWGINTVLRIWKASNGFGKSWTSVQPTVNLVSGGWWTGNYSWTFSYNAGYSHTNGWVKLNSKSSANGSFVVNKPLMLPEISILLQCLYSKMTICCDNAQKDRMLADYILATSLFQNFIVAGQAGTLPGASINSAELSLMLNGSDCKPGILPILKLHGCYDDGTISEELLSNYDWCLCPDTGGGGGGLTTNRESYNAGNGAWISSDATDDDDRWTFATQFGIGTFTQNLPNSRIFGGTVQGDASTATYNSNGATQSFKLVIPTHGVEANVDYMSALLANVQVFSAHHDDPSDNARWVLDSGSVQVGVVGIASNTISFVFTGIGATYPDGWAIAFKLP